MVLLCVPAFAQETLPPVKVLPELPEVPAENLSKMPEQDIAGARCFELFNQAPYTVQGTIITNYYMSSSGVPARARSNFRLTSGQNTEFCSYGPFFGESEDRLILVLRTLIPIFTCEFTAEGRISIYGHRKPEGGTETFANCD
jgi:hypothetical protein